MGIRSATLCIVLSALCTVKGQYNVGRGYNQQVRGYPESQSSERRIDEPAGKVKIDVYYETDCPDSMNFITNQLQPAYQDFQDIVDIQLVPFGKAQEVPLQNGSYRFICHHGPSECYGNVIQSCAIHYYGETSKHLPFISCMESYRKPSQNGKKCARRNGLDWNTLESCAEGDLGERLLHTNAKLTTDLRPNLHFVPWIVINNNYSYKNQRTALRNLRNAVCESYTGTHPRCYGRL